MEPYIELKKGRSKVWQYFGRLVKDGERVDDGLWHCKVCLEENKTMTYKEKNSTATMMYHLKAVHRIDVMEIEELEKLENEQTPSVSGKISTSGSNKRNKKAIEWIDIKSEMISNADEDESYTSDESQPAFSSPNEPSHHSSTKQKAFDSIDEQPAKKKKSSEQSTEHFCLSLVHHLNLLTPAKRLHTMSQIQTVLANAFE